ncbi:MAG TPA: SDR family NAD(P)-dependent oxidoreductase [Nocardioides sp.]|uniref:SDR family NAD(P)-dependent oxidoreductase n=1 Tax=Nocardioides sp. TaxID=35761 RepID=UPI002E3032FD|nr:SDR family NAD(P)-dependent oxidoreductase [Nocardioides sp.]HEX5087652.1 SDR family NAD(P)-dependent oxidoreductase [Nocardioides sp.]
MTGASSGIGRAVALRLAAEGAQVLVHGRDAARTEEVARLTGGSPLVADLAVPGSHGDLADRALAVDGRIDILVAGAGAGWSGPFAGMGDGELRRLVELDLVAPLALTRAVLPGMVARNCGQIVLVGSVAGRTGVAGEAVYAAAKAGLDAFAESLRLELVGSGVSVSVVVPGAVRTSFFDNRGRPYGRRFPRPVDPERVAAVTLDVVRHGRPEAWVPRWLAVAPSVRALAPRAFRRLSARFGEQVRSGGVEGPP